jgi:c-di-GMP-binding flagellar brake protein YcgR
MLQQLQRKNIPVFLHTADGQFDESRVLYVDAAKNTLLLAYTQNSSLNRKAYEEGACFYTEHFGAQVQFYVQNITRALFQKGYVFSLNIPSEVYRIQRRENFRAEVPADNQVACTIPMNGNGPIEVQIADISRNGVALVDPMNRLKVDKGKLLCNCQLRLPKLGAIQADMQVCNRAQVEIPDMGEFARIGCRFVSINSTMENLLQRYIDQLAFDRRSSI